MDEILTRNISWKWLLIVLSSMFLGAFILLSSASYILLSVWRCKEQLKESPLHLILETIRKNCRKYLLFFQFGRFLQPFRIKTYINSCMHPKLNNYWSEKYFYLNFYTRLT